MQDVIERLRHLDVAAHVMIDETETRVFEKRADNLLGNGGVVVHAEHLMSLVEETLAQMRTDETGAARHQISRHGSVLLNNM
jgi:hypothetical protein